MKDVLAAISFGEPSTGLIQRFPNGDNPRICMPPHTEYIGEEANRGSETSQYLEEKKSTEILLVAASENGLGLNLIV